MPDPAPDEPLAEPVWGVRDADRSAKLDRRLRQVFTRVRDAALARGERTLATSDAPAAALERLVAEAYALVGDAAAATPARPLVECGRGCAFCCHQEVRVTAPEAIAIARALAEAFPADWLERLQAMLRQRVALIAGLPGVRDYAQARLPCAFLAPDGACAVYDWRPVVCRGYHSLSRADCQEKYVDFAAKPPPIERVGHTAANATVRGLTLALRAARRDDGLYELHGAVLRALETPDAAARWARGERLFQGCRGG